MIAERVTARVPMHDGVHLETVVFLPGGAGPFPAELLRTPYGIEDRVGDAERMTADGVAVVVQSCRGRFGSDGAFDLGVADPADGAATVEWIRAQPWSDGRVALWGFSYGGFTQWATVLGGARGLTSICPSMCPPPGQRLDFRRQGALEWAALAHWLPRQAAVGSGLDQAAALELLGRAFDPASVVDGSGRVDDAASLAHPTVGRHPMAEPWAVAGADDYERLWRAVFAGDETLGRGRSAVEVFPDDAVIDVPALVVGSWYDLWSEEPGVAFEWLRAHSATADIAASHRLVLAGAGHGFHPLEGVETGSEVNRFGLDLDHRWALEWVRGTPGPLRSLAPVTWFLIGPNEWRSAQQWPPEGSEVHALAIDGGGRDASTIPVDPRRPVPTRGGAGMLLPPGPWDQAGLSSADRDDVASFLFAPVEESLVLAGPVNAALTVSADAPDADVAVKLVDVAPDGEAMSICDGIVRLRWRTGEGSARLLQPGEPTHVQVRLGAVGYQVDRGHRLRLDVTGTNFPRYAVNAHTGAEEGSDEADDLRVAELTLHHSSARPAILTLTTVPGASS